MQVRNPIIKRIYADWTKSGMRKWKEPANEHSFRLIEAPSYVSGKNTTDIALIMDAMDILHSETIKVLSYQVIVIIRCWLNGYGKMG